jgi:uncharacterized SAM-binding protein YcdF (DUF218 family)
VPANAIAVLAGPHDTTVDEAKSFRDLVRSRGRHRVIIVTSKMRTRRARLMIKRQLKGPDVQVATRASRYDVAHSACWWRHRSDIRIAVFELQRFVLYRVGAMT